jgi:hypothetical protein
VSLRVLYVFSAIIRLRAFSISSNVSALDAVPELISILPDVKATNDFIKKPVALDDFISAVRTAIAR